MKFHLLLTTALLLAACASKKTVSDYTDTPEYQGRELLADSVSITADHSLSPEEINTLLSSRVDLRHPLKIAVAQSSDMATSNGWGPLLLSPIATPDSADVFQEVITKSKYIKDLSVIPRFMMPKNFPSKLREILQP